MEAPWTEESIFDSYTIIEETFKTVSSHEIKTAILIPKQLKPGPRPVIYHLHGGFLVTAHGLFAAFFPKWLHKLAIEHSAVVISPDYRLLPSENGVADILEDVEDGWQFSKWKLPEILKTKAPGLTLDFSQTLLAGGSAGGYCATQLALSHPDDFRVLASIYPLIDAKNRLYVEGLQPGDPAVLRFPLEDLPSKEETLAWIKEKRTVPHTKDGVSRTPFAVAACHSGLFASKLFDNKSLNRPEFYPLERVEGGNRLPPRIWMMHGDDDSTVPIDGSTRFVDLVRKSLPGVTVRYDILPGLDHAFDFDETTWESFAHEALKFVTDGWLKAEL